MRAAHRAVAVLVTRGCHPVIVVLPGHAEVRVVRALRGSVVAG